MLRFDTHNSVLLVIDIQGKLAQGMFQKDILFKNCQSLIQSAQILGIPTLLTEQAPHKIGATSEEIRRVLKTEPIKKSTFSCVQEEAFMQALRASLRKQVIVCGIEAHVCVYQSVCDLLEQQFDVQVVSDATSSRKQSDRDLALERLRQSKAEITSTEMIICEWLQGSHHPKFKDVMALIK